VRRKGNGNSAVLVPLEASFGDMIMLSHHVSGTSSKVLLVQQSKA